MKLTLKQLKKIIIEAAQASYGLADNFGIITDYNSPYFKHRSSDYMTQFNFGLFNVTETLNELRSDQCTKHNIGDAIISNLKAMLSIKVPNYPQNGAYEVSRSAADSNFGPTLYDMVMSVTPNGLTPDRLDVSSEAERVWDYYANKRPDVEKSFLDDIGFPITPTKNDDTYIELSKKPADPKYFEPTYDFDYQVTRDQYLNMSYNINEKSQEYDLLVNNFEIFINFLETIPANTNKAMKTYHEYKNKDMSVAVGGFAGNATERIVGTFFKDRY